ncbi:MAG: 3-phosphoshikimate 1-carboxyvinyltransferase [Oscillospiraceae bacterium]|nr:3-phosphoshikimate 1-carboxyvinyltransferase [Oscillospiraceae bacterium]
MQIKITPTLLKGRITPPSSKSISHRALICSILAKCDEPKNLLDSDDIWATRNAFTATENIDCNESGSTLRFLIPVFAAMGKTVTFHGRGELPNRTIEPYIDELPKHGITFHTTEMPYKISGQLQAGEYLISGSLSSQFITGLLLALPLLDGDSEIILTSPLQSKPYVDLTIDVMKQFGVGVQETPQGYSVKGNQSYQPCDFSVETDMSQAAFFAVANKLGADIEIAGLNPNSLQGDKKVFDIVKSPPPYNIDAGDIPDLVPILTVLCALTDGEHRIYNCSRLRIKECDRLAAISTELNKLGACVKINESDELIITGVEQLSGTNLPLKAGIQTQVLCSTWNDHRIAMALTIAAMKCMDFLILENAECVKKSYVNFYDDIRKLGGIIDVVDV